MKPKVIRLWLLLIGLIGLAGCSGFETGAESGGAAAQLTAECQVFYRESVTVGIQQEEILSFSADTGEMLTFDDLVFQAQYVDGSEAWESRSLRLAVSAVGQEEQPLMAQLLQLDKQEAPRNQFEGGHGFTGLNYVYHPTSGAELQYYCLAK